MNDMLVLFGKIFKGFMAAFSVITLILGFYLGGNMYSYHFNIGLAFIGSIVAFVVDVFFLGLIGIFCELIEEVKKNNLKMDKSYGLLCELIGEVKKNNMKMDKFLENGEKLEQEKQKINLEQNKEIGNSVDIVV